MFVGEGVEGKPGIVRCIVFPLSAALFCCSNGCSAGVFYNMQVPTSPRLAFTLAAYLPPAQRFYKHGGVMSGCRNDDGTYLLEQNVQTRCASRIINLKLLILCKQSTQQPGFLCLMHMERLHCHSLPHMHIYLFLYYCKIQKGKNKACSGLQ